MQIDESALVDGKPVPPKGCPGRMGTPCPRKVQRRGCYGTKSSEMPTFCFRCTLCDKLFSVRPKGQLPHQSKSAEQIAQCIENTLSVPDNANNKSAPDKRWQRRAFNAFESQRMLLAALFSMNLDSSAKDVWDHLKRRHGNTQSIVEELHRASGLSLTGTYRCLRPWWVEAWNSWALPP